MTERRADELEPCPRKGCSWRGRKGASCPMHDADEAWDRQWQLWPADGAGRRR